MEGHPNLLRRRTMKLEIYKVGIALLIFGAIGCQNTADGLKEDAEINSKKASRTAEDVGAKTLETGSDVSAAMTMTPAVKKALQEDTGLAAAIDTIDVDSTEEKVVLNGSVPSEDLKNRATEIAARVIKERNGKQSVDNQLKVQP
jgi:osmotically-inducible protein OsmY